MEFKAKVRILSHKGHGVVDHPDGRVFFAKRTWPGDEGTFSIEDKAKSYAEASVVQLDILSDQRVEVECAHQEICGGCPWMIVNYAEQVRAKEQRVSFLLDKNNIPVLHRFPLIEAREKLGYRNRAQFKTDGKKIGYMSEGSHNLAAIDDCLILNDKMKSLFQTLKSSLPKKEWEPTGKHLWNFLEVDDGQKAQEVTANKRRPFRQGNSAQNESMKAWLHEVIKDISPDAPVMEAFCGSGNLTEVFVSRAFKNILAAEVRGSALEELRSKKLAGVKVFEIDMNSKGVWKQLARQQKSTKVLVVDPPREGLEERAEIFQHLPDLESIIYISCEPTTWSRDIKDFQTQGWSVESLTPLDMFPQTPHIELLTILKRS
ncbi:MAG: RsmD family RNA methyltransferase [Bacteriovoracaceae bacterium]|nr:RsmD family RNA methyltransferase [Bacteriovoracaceae bacterium]